MGDLMLLPLVNVVALARLFSSSWSVGLVSFFSQIRQGLRGWQRDHLMLHGASAPYFQRLLEPIGGVYGCWACTVPNALSLQQFAHTDLSPKMHSLQSMMFTSCATQIAWSTTPTNCGGSLNNRIADNHVVPCEARNST